MTGLAEATAGEWYACAELGHGVVHLHEHHIDPFYRCNIWFVRGRELNVLVDSGLGAVSLVAQFPWLQARAVLAIASHTHFDHIGNHHEFGARACHRLEAPILAQPTREATVATQ